VSKLLTHNAVGSRLNQPDEKYIKPVGRPSFGALVVCEENVEDSSLFPYSFSL
jgi:hypothetical protein